MQAHSEDPVVAAILGNDVKVSKSVICAVLAFLEAVEEDMGNAAGLLRLK